MPQSPQIRSSEQIFEMVSERGSYLAFVVPTDVGLSIVLSERPLNAGRSVTNSIEQLVPLADRILNHMGAHPRRRYFETYLFETNKAEACRLDEITRVRPPSWRATPPLAASELLGHCVRLAAAMLGFEPSTEVMERLEEMSGIDEALPIPPLR